MNDVNTESYPFRVVSRVLQFLHPFLLVELSFSSSSYQQIIVAPQNDHYQSYDTYYYISSYVMM